jgi:hypothetical protein
MLAAEPGDDLNLDGNANRQLGHTDRCTGMAPGITEHLDQQIRAPIQDRRGLVETRGHVHHAKDLDNPLDPVQIAEFGLKGGENRQGRHPRCFATLLHSKISADLAAYHLVTSNRAMPAHVHQPFIDDTAEVVTGGRERRRQLDPQRLQPVSNRHGRSVAAALATILRPDSDARPGFVLAAMRYRAQDAADLAWRSADAVLRSPTKSNLFVWLPVLGIVLAVAHHDGWCGLVANAQNLIETWAGLYAAVRAGRWYRKVKPPEPRRAGIATAGGDSHNDTSES